jgi:hypothetical protein
MLALREAPYRMRRGRSTTFPIRQQWSLNQQGLKSQSGITHRTAYIGAQQRDISTLWGTDRKASAEYRYLLQPGVLLGLVLTLGAQVDRQIGRIGHFYCGIAV